MEDFWRQESSVWSKNDIITWTANFQFHLSFRTGHLGWGFEKEEQKKIQINTSIHGKPSISQLASTHICFVLYVTGLEDQKCTSLRDSCIFQASVVVLIFYRLKSEFSLAQLLLYEGLWWINSVSCLLNQSFCVSYWYILFVLSVHRGWRLALTFDHQISCWLVDNGLMWLIGCSLMRCMPCVIGKILCWPGGLNGWILCLRASCIWIWWSACVDGRGVWCRHKFGVFLTSSPSW